MKPIIDCKICGADSFFLCNTFNEHSHTIKLSHYRCQNCGTVFIGNSITIEEIGIAYSTIDNNAYYEETRIETDRKLAASISDLERIGLPKSAKIIDIGTGNGRFLEMLQTAGFENIAGHETPGAEVEISKKCNIHIFQDYDYSSLPSGYFDCITLLDVVEHVIDPNFLFAQCSRILKENGILYFHTPVVTRTDRIMHIIQSLRFIRKFGVVWQRGRTSIFHLQNYTQASIKHLLNKNGYKIITINIKNELSWPIRRYIRVYLCEKHGLPNYFVPILTPLFWLLLGTNIFNGNKAIVMAKKA